jgi:hypothetical protein
MIVDPEIPRLPGMTRVITKQIVSRNRNSR